MWIQSDWQAMRNVIWGRSGTGERSGFRARTELPTGLYIRIRGDEFVAVSKLELTFEPCAGLQEPGNSPL